jgi:hypothetical protein
LTAPADAGNLEDCIAHLLGRARRMTRCCAST